MDPEPGSFLINFIIEPLAVTGNVSAGRIFLYCLIIFGLILLNAFFSMSEMAIISLNDNKVDRMAAEGHKRAKKIVSLVENPSGKAVGSNLFSGDDYINKAKEALSLSRQNGYNRYTLLNM